MNLTEHFTLEELTATSHREFDNTPPDELLPNLQTLAEGLERVRTALGGLAMHINSGYRSPEVNAAVGSKSTSQHMKGQAADIICPAFGTPLEICEALKPRLQELGVDQMIWEFGSWVHVSFAPNPRYNILTIDKRGTRVGLA